MEFERCLEDNIFKLHYELSSGRYQHGPYSTFHIYDPKHRVISKALVRDRLVHHVVFNELYRIFDPTFIHHSYSSRLNKGTHLAVLNLFHCLRQVSRNYTQTVHILKCDVKKFFWSVDHQKLLAIIQSKIKDEKFLWLINEIVKSFPPSFAGASADKSAGRPVDKIPERERERVKGIPCSGKGLPIGNVTSQIFANIYLDKLDQFIKHRLKIRDYFRYADDFVIVHPEKEFLQTTLTQIQQFLQEELLLELHPGKVSIQKFSQGVDFLGYVSLPRYIVLRTKTKKRMLKKIRQRRQELERGTITPESFNQSLQSYLGILKHCKGREIERKVWEIVEDPQNFSESLEYRLQDGVLLFTVVSKNDII